MRGLCFDGGDLIFTNEQRDVYRVDRYLQRSFSDLLPPIGSGTLPVCAAGCDLTSGACDHSGPVSVQGLREGEHLRWVLAGGRIHLQGRLIPAGPLQETKPGGRQLGTCVLLLFGRAPTLWLSSAETLAIVADGDGQPMLRRLDLTADRVDLQEVKGATFAAVSETDPAGPYVSFSASFPASLALGDDPSATSFRCELRSLGLHGDGGDLTLTGLDPTALFHPYAWAEIEVKR